MSLLVAQAMISWKGIGGDDLLFGGVGSDTLIGGEGDDYIIGNGEGSLGDGNDVFDGGAGNDLLADTAGSNTYKFGRGYGQDVIQNIDDFPGQDIDTLLLPDILPSDITVQQYQGNFYPLHFGDVGDLEILVNGSPDRFILNHWVEWQDSAFVYNPYFQIEHIQFANGTVWGTADLIAHAVGVTRTGTEGDDQDLTVRLDGSVFDDVLIGWAAMTS